MQVKCSPAMLIALVFAVCGCGTQNAGTPEEAIKAFIEEEMLVTTGKYLGVKEGEGETFGEVVKSYEPKTLHADLKVRGRTQRHKGAGPIDKRAQFQEETIPKGTKVYRLVFTYIGAPGGFEKTNTRGWRLQNPRHASKYKDQGGRGQNEQCDAVFYVDNANRVLWVSPADFWKHEDGQLEIIREKGLETEPGINEIHAF